MALEPYSQPITHHGHVIWVTKHHYFHLLDTEKEDFRFIYMMGIKTCALILEENAYIDDVN